MIKACIFDLDGTIADTVESIAHAVNRVLEHFGLVPRPVEAFNFYAGDGFDLAVERALKDAGDAELNYLQEGIRLGRAWFNEDPLYHVKPYPNMRETLTALREEVPIAVCSNKPRLQTHSAPDRKSACTLAIPIRICRPETPQVCLPLV